MDAGVVGCNGCAIARNGGCWVEFAGGSRRRQRAVGGHGDGRAQRTMREESRGWRASCVLRRALSVERAQGGRGAPGACRPAEQQAARAEEARGEGSSGLTDWRAGGLPMRRRAAGGARRAKLAGAGRAERLSKVQREPDEPALARIGTSAGCSQMCLPALDGPFFSSRRRRPRLGLHPRTRQSLTRSCRPPLPDECS